jgi:hypothetical protein
VTDAQALPTPSFEVLAQVLATPCYVHLGLVPNPATGKAEKDLDQARWALDLLHVLHEKTKGAATADETARLESMLHQLRDAFARA